MSVLAKLRKHIAKKWPQIHWTGWRLHHNNAQPYVVNHIMQILVKFNITCVLHPPYSPDLAPCDFLFPSLKAKLLGIQFETSEAVLKKSEAILKDLTKNGQSMTNEGNFEEVAEFKYLGTRIEGFGAKTR